MTTIVKTYRSGANRSLAAALVAGPDSDFGRKKIRFAAQILAANNRFGKITLPADFANAAAFIKMASAVGDVRIAESYLPAEVVKEARARGRARLLKGSRRPVPPRHRHTAPQGGRKAPKAKKAKKAAEDRAMREAMRGPSGK